MEHNGQDTQQDEAAARRAAMREAMKRRRREQVEVPGVGTLYVHELTAREHMNWVYSAPKPNEPDYPQKFNHALLRLMCMAVRDEQGEAILSIEDAAELGMEATNALMPVVMDLNRVLARDLDTEKKG